MTQSTDAHTTADLFERAVEANRDVLARLTEPPKDGDGIAALEQGARGTALIHELRQSIDRLNRLLPFKG